MNFLPKILLVFILSFGWAACAETNSATPIASEPKAVTVSKSEAKDTEHPISAEELNRHYVEILEKTNGQLSLWWNPMGVFVGALGVLFAVGAIVAGLIIFKQSAEYKKSFVAFEKRYSAIIDRMIQEKVTQLEAFQANIDGSIRKLKEDQEKHLQTATNEQKEQFESAIASLELVKKNVVDQLQRPPVPSQFLALTGSAFSLPSSFYPTAEKFHQCTKCGWGFKVQNPFFYASAMGGGPTVACPACGNLDSIS